MTAGDVLRWMAHAPAERASLPASCALWTAAEIMHAASVPGMDIGLSAAALAGLAYGSSGAAKTAESRTHRKQAAAVAAITGAWLTAAAEGGPLAGHIGPVPAPLSVLWVGGTLIGYRALRAHEVVRIKREWRKAKADWLSVKAPAYGLNGSHLLEYERTRLGEAWTVDVTGTGKRASGLVNGTLAEDIAQYETLAVNRVRVTEARIAGRIRISIRRRDPWKDAIEHPVLATDPEIGLPVPCTVREPLIVGQDPESGKPLRITLWDADGAKNVFLVGIKGAGKTALLNCIRERLTAAADAVIFDINVWKAREDAEWAPACDLSAIGPADRKRALYILRCANRAVIYRSAQPRASASFQPSAAEPLIVVMIDEIDKLVKGSDYLAAAIKQELKDLASAGRSEGVVLLMAGQRGTAEWVGGSDIRSQIDVFGVGKVGRRGEMHHAAGDMGLVMPDMATYGEGHAGVWVLAELGGDFHIGRTFKLTEPPDLRRLAHERAASRPPLEPGLVAHLGKLYEQLKAHPGGAAGRPAQPAQAAQGSYSPVTDGPSPVGTAVMDRDPLDALDSEMESVLPDDLRERLRRMDQRNAETRRLQGEADAIELPDVDPAKIAESVRERWAQAAEQTKIPPEARARLIMLLTGEGMSGRKITEAFPGTDRKLIMLWLNRLRWEGAVGDPGRGRGARWKLTSQDGDAP
jgi:hypothetical protein